MKAMNMMRVSWAMSSGVWFFFLVLFCIWLGWWATAIAVFFLLLPDVSLIGAFAEKGRLKPSRVNFYNQMHVMTLPIGMILVGLAAFFITGGLNGGFWPVALGGIAWFVHAAADRAFGFGLRDENGSIIPVTGGFA